MGPGGRLIWIGLGALWCVALGYVFGRDRMLSFSVDMSHHLQLVDVFRDHWRVPVEYQGYLLETYFYPKLSHRFAAVLDRTGVGELAALTIAGMTAAAAGWLMLFDQARRVSLWVLGGALALAALAARQLRAVLGQEIVGSFFYPQLVSEAVFVAAAVAGAAALRRSRSLFLLFTLLAVWACGGFHLVGALKLAGALMVLAAFEMAADMRIARRLDWRLALSLVAAPAALLANPAFWTMRKLAAHNGGINFAAPITATHMGLAAGVLLALSAWVLMAALVRHGPGWREAPPAWRAAVVIAAMGAAAAGAALAQLAAFELLGEGSPYAVLKHTFGVVTLLALVAPLWLWSLRGGAAANRPRLGAAAAVAAQAGLVWLLFHHASWIDMGETRRIFEAARQFRIDQGLKAGESRALFVSARRPREVAFAASVAMLRAPRDVNALGIYLTGHPLAPEDLPTILTEQGDPNYDIAACRAAPPPSPLVAVRGPCAAPPRLSFVTGAAGTAYLRDGWSLPEPAGVWSLGQRAVVELPLPASAAAAEALQLQIETIGFTPVKSPRRAVRVWLEGGPSESFVFDRATALNHVFVLSPPKGAIAVGKVRIVFEVADPISPKAVGAGEDSRRLGVGLQAIRLFPRSAGALAGAAQAP
jgi:hypothetical protein